MCEFHISVSAVILQNVILFIGTQAEIRAYIHVVLSYVICSSVNNFSVSVLWGFAVFLAYNII